MDGAGFEPQNQAQVLTVVRDLDASRELVWAAFTRPEMLAEWWGPVPHPAVAIDMDVRAGGRWRNCLRSVETGEDLWQHGVFTEVRPPEKLVFTFVWEEDGERGHENEVTITFDDMSTEDGGEQTRLTLTQTPFRTGESRDGHGFGWNSSFDRLSALLAKA